MKNLILLFCIVFFPVFLMGQSGSQTPVGGLSYAPDSNYVIYSQMYRGRNGVAVWVHKDSVNWGINYDSVLFVSNNGLQGEPGNMSKPFTGIEEAVEYAYTYNMSKAKVIVLDGENYDLNSMYIDSLPIQIETFGNVSNFLTRGLNSVTIKARHISNFNTIGNAPISFLADTITLTSTSRTIETGNNLTFIRANVIIANSLIKSAGQGTKGKVSLDLYCSDYYANDGPWLNSGFNASQKNQTINFECINYRRFHNSDIVGCYQASLDSSIVNFKAKRIIDEVPISTGMIYWQPDGGGGSTIDYKMNFNVGYYVGNSQILNFCLGKAANRGRLNVNFEKYTYTGVSNFIGAPSSVYDTIILSGNYYSTTPLYSGGGLNVNLRIKNADIFCNQANPVITSTSAGFKLSVENSIISNNGATSIFDYGVAKTINVNDAYTYGPLIADSQVTFRRLNEMGLSTITSNIYNTDGALTGNRTVTGASNNLAFTGMNNLTATGSGTATYRFNLYPSSSLPLLLEQTSAGDTAYLQLRASLGRATLRATQDIYLEAANSVFVSPLEGSSTGIVSARPTGELIRREEAFFNAYFISDTITVAASETEINSTFLDAISPSFTVSGDSIIYAGTDTAYFDIGYYTEAEILESATGTYLLELSCYKNGLKVFPSESWHKVYFTATETQPIQTVSKRFYTQLVSGDVLNIRQNGTAAISAALHNFSFTGQKIQ